MRRFAIAVGLIAGLATGASASAATFTSQSGFGTGGGFSSCKTATVNAAFASGQVIGAADYDDICVGAFTVSLDTALKTITLTGFQSGNYEEGFLEITGIAGETITSLSTITYTGLFDPTFYGNSNTAVPAPQLSFTGSSIKILFSAFGGTAPDDQFTYDSRGGQAVFAYNSGAVPEPATWALLIGGFGMAGARLRRRKAVLA